MNDLNNATESTALDIIPLVAVEGTAYECGQQYGEVLRERFPELVPNLWKYWRGCDSLDTWGKLPGQIQQLFEQNAPQVLEIHRGLMQACPGPTSVEASAGLASDEKNAGCTSFSVSGSWTATGHPLSGQTKDTPRANQDDYIVLRMRIKDAPTILTLCYPGEVLGYGLWSNGMSIFRNSLYSPPSEVGLTMQQWGLLAMASGSAQQGAELAKTHGVRGSGHCLLSDAGGMSVGVEFNAGGVGAIPTHDGINVHSNHPLLRETAAHDESSPSHLADSQHRLQQVRRLLESLRGQLTPSATLNCLADHSCFPHGVCCHADFGSTGYGTTAGVISEPTLGRLHVVKGNPCQGCAVTYSI